MNRLALVAVLLCLLSGVFQAMQAPTNGLLARPLGSAVNAAWVSFAVGLVALTVLGLVFRVQPDLAGAGKLPPYAWLGGLYGAVFIASTAFAAPRLGVASVITLLVLGQLIASIVIDHTGAFGVAVRPVSLARLAGVALVLAGVVLVRRF